MPDSYVSIRKRLASVDINHTNIEVEIDTRIVFTDIMAVDLAINGIRTEDDIGSKQAGVVLDCGVLIALDGRRLSPRRRRLLRSASRRWKRLSALLATKASLRASTVTSLALVLAMYSIRISSLNVL